MDSKAFLEIAPTGEQGRWVMVVPPRLCTGGGFLFGGAGLAAAVSAMEQLTGRHCIWATAQYLSYARSGETMLIDVTLAVVGRQITQARAVCHVGDREILTVNAALGERKFEHAGQFVNMPEVPRPDDLPARWHRHPVENTIHERLEQRLVIGRDLEQLDGSLSDGRTLMWARIPDVLTDVDTATLAVMGDFVPMGIGQALGVLGGGNSLDNTLRIVRLVPTKWVLLDIQIYAVERGFGHGSVTMFAEDGTLLATASQSCIARLWRK
ncbi:MAG: acyl-CoA thioesterase [Ilumatobacteraceae bacterium]